MTDLEQENARLRVELAAARAALRHVFEEFDGLEHCEYSGCGVLAYHGRPGNLPHEHFIKQSEHWPAIEAAGIVFPCSRGDV